MNLRKLGTVSSHLALRVLPLARLAAGGGGGKATSSQSSESGGGKSAPGIVGCGSAPLGRPGVKRTSSSASSWDSPSDTKAMVRVMDLGISQPEPWEGFNPMNILQFGRSPVRPLLTLILKAF